MADINTLMSSSSAGSGRSSLELSPRLSENILCCGREQADRLGGDGAVPGGERGAPWAGTEELVELMLRIEDKSLGAQRAVKFGEEVLQCRAGTSGIHTALARAY